MAEDVAALALDGVRFPRMDKTGIPLVLTGVEKLRARDVDWTLLSPRVVNLEFLPSGNNQLITAGKSFTAQVKVMNGPQEGLGKVELKIGGRTWTNWVWLHANEERELTFAGLTVAASGQHEVIVGGLKKNVTVGERP